MTPLRRSAWLLALLGALRLCDPANQIFETSIAVDGVELPLRLFEGQTVVTAAENFVLEHGLIAPSQEPMASLLVAQLAEALRERVASAADAAPAHAAERVTGAPAPLLTVTVAVDGRDHVFEFFAGADPVRAAHDFCGKLGVNAVAHSRCRKQLVDEVVAQLARRKPLVDAPKDETPLPPLLEVAVRLSEDGDERMLRVNPGESPESAARAFCAVNGIEPNDHLAVLTHEIEARLRARREAVVSDAWSRARASEPVPEEPAGQLLFSIPVTLAGRVYSVEYHEGESALGAASAFCESMWNTIARRLLELDQLESYSVGECTDLLEKTVLIMLDSLLAPNVTDVPTAGGR